jgi:hypothetical protein
MPRGYKGSSPHASYAGYRNGCRCAACTRANREYGRAWSAANRDKVNQLQNARIRRLAYGLSVQEFAVLLVAQEGRCAICGVRFDDSIRRMGAYVDHSHATGRVRGLLCRTHNLAIGSFNDDPALLRAAADYLERTQM